MRDRIPRRSAETPALGTSSRGLELGAEEEAEPLMSQVQLVSRAATRADGKTVPEAAAQGLATPETALPHRAELQAAFGPEHDLNGIRAHVGGDAAAACDDMGATAFASGNHVVFAGQPDLHTAAHEAAHVVQQAQGIHLYGGVGEAGDAHERQADAVADRVVAGRSASDLLRGPATSAAHAGAGRPVQRQERKTWGPKGATPDEQKAQHIKTGEASGTALAAVVVYAAQRIGDAVTALEEIHTGFLASTPGNDRDGWLASAQKEVADVSTVASDLQSAHQSIGGSKAKHPELTLPLAMLDHKWSQLSKLVAGFGKGMATKPLDALGAVAGQLHHEAGLDAKGASIDPQALAALEKKEGEGGKWAALYPALTASLAAAKEATLDARMVLGKDDPHVLGAAFTVLGNHLRDVNSLIRQSQVPDDDRDEVLALLKDVITLIQEGITNTQVAHTPTVEVAFRALGREFSHLGDFVDHLDWRRLRHR